MRQYLPAGASGTLYDPRFEHDACGVGFVADVNGLAGELKEAKLDEHLAEAAHIGRQLGLTEEDLAARLSRAHRNLETQK